MTRAFSTLAAEPRSPQRGAVLFAGAWHYEEFAWVRGDADPPGRAPWVADVDAAAEEIVRRDEPPEVVLLALPRPGVSHERLVERLAAELPLTRIVVVAGSWCEGGFRTAAPIAGVIRLYWHELPAWLRAAEGMASRGDAPPWSAALDDVRAGQSVGSIIDELAAAPIGGEAAVVAVDAVDLASFEALHDSLGEWGWECVWQPRQRPEVWREASRKASPVAGIWDGSQLDDAERMTLAESAGRLNGAPVLTLLTYPRWEHVALIRDAGGAGMMGKPYQPALLASELRRLVARHQSDAIAARTISRRQSGS